MKQNVIDTANGSFAGSLIFATVAGLSLQDWAALAALIYSLLLIADKIGLLQLTRAMFMQCLRWGCRKGREYWRGICQ